MSDQTEVTEEKSVTLPQALAAAAVAVAIPTIYVRIRYSNNARSLKDRVKDSLFGPIENFDYDPK